MAGLLDFIQGASKGFWAGNLGAPVDMATIALNSLIAGGGYAGHKVGLLSTPPALIEKPVGGSEWIAEKMRGVGLLQDNPGSQADAYGQVAGGLLGPVVAAKSPQIASGLLQAADNLSAPTQLNKQAGVTMGNSMAEKLGGKGKVAIITGQLGASNLNERIDGVKEALAAFPDIEIVATEGTEDDLAKAVSVTEAILRGNPDLAGIFGMSQVGGPAVAKVLAQQEFSDRKGAVAVFAFDDLPDTIQGVKDGYINGIMVQRPVTMGKLAVEQLVSQIKGEAAGGDIDTGVTVVNADNLGSYTK